MPPAQMDSAWVSLASPSRDGSESLADRIRRIQADLGDLNAFYSISISPARHRRLQQFYSEELHSLSQVEFEALNQQDKVDCLLLGSFLRRRARQLKLAKDGYTALEPLLPFASSILSLCERREQVEPMDAEQAAQQLDSIKTMVARAHRAVEDGDVKASKPDALQASRIVGELRSHLGRFFEFYSSYDPLFDWWATTPWRAADEALGLYLLLIQTKLAGVRTDGTGDIVGQPIGREALLSELEAEMIAYTPEELVAVGNEKFRWCRRQMKGASRELGYGDDWKRALEHVKTRSAPPSEQTQLVLGLAREGTRFVRDHDLVTVPELAEETYRMDMMSPEEQRVAPFFLGGSSIRVAYPTAEMDYDLKKMVMRGNNRHFARATAFHELIPGHRLQLFMMERHRSYRRLFMTPFFVEGWTTYWEMVLWDRSDFFVSPMDRIGTMFWRMHRCARIVLSLKFHLGQIQPQECIDLLVSWVGHERSTAEGEVRRWLDHGYGPLYQAAYLVGALQLVELRREVLEAGRMTEKQFHDRVLTLGAIPNELLRALVLDTDLKADYKAKWRFYK